MKNLVINLFIFALLSGASDFIFQQCNISPRNAHFNAIVLFFIFGVSQVILNLKIKVDADQAFVFQFMSVTIFQFLTLLVTTALMIYKFNDRASVIPFISAGFVLILVQTYLLVRKR